MFLLDTNVISELRKAGDGRANEHVVAWISICRSETIERFGDLTTGRASPEIWP